MNFITNLLAGPLASLVRHGLGFITAGVVSSEAMAGHGHDANSLGSILVLVGVYVVITIWSLLSKKAVSDENRAWVRTTMESLVSNFLPLLFGWMTARGYSGQYDDPVAAGTWATSAAATAILSVLRKRKPSVEVKSSFLLLFLVISYMPLAGCALPGKVCIPVAKTESWNIGACILIGDK